MKQETPKPGPSGTTDQSPRWEGPEETRPRGCLPAKDNPAVDRDAAGENLNDPDRKKATDVGKTKGDDADGQFAKPMKHSDNNGVASAKPRVITGSDDATAHKAPYRR